VAKNERLEDCHHCGGPGEIKRFTGMLTGAAALALWACLVAASKDDDTNGRG